MSMNENCLCVLVVTKTAKVSVSVSGVGLGLDHAGLGLGLGLGLRGLDNISAYCNFTTEAHSVVSFVLTCRKSVCSESLTN